MTIWYVDIMWGFMLFGITVFCGALVVANRAMRSMRGMCLATCYAVGVWMAMTLAWKVALVTWCVFAAFGGFVVLAYELWARHRYAGTGRRARPLILLQGLVLWPAMLPEGHGGRQLLGGTANATLISAWRDVFNPRFCTSPNL